MNRYIMSLIMLLLMVMIIPMASAVKKDLCFIDYDEDGDVIDVYTEDGNSYIAWYCATWDWDEEGCTTEEHIDQATFWDDNEADYDVDLSCGSRMAGTCTYHCADAEGTDWHCGSVYLDDDDDVDEYYEDNNYVHDNEWETVEMIKGQYNEFMVGIENPTYFEYLDFENSVDSELPNGWSVNFEWNTKKIAPDDIDWVIVNVWVPADFNGNWPIITICHDCYTIGFSHFDQTTIFHTCLKV